MAQALARGLAAGNRNMGLMLAAAGAAVGELTWLYFAIAQFPIYLMPAMLKPLARRFAANPSARSGIGVRSMKADQFRLSPRKRGPSSLASGPPLSRG